MMAQFIPPIDPETMEFGSEQTSHAR